MNSRERMRISNQKAIKWLIDNGYDEIHVFSPTKRKDNVYFNKEHASEQRLAYSIPTKNDPKIYRYQATDVWNLWDAVCFKREEIADLESGGTKIVLEECWVQVKTNSWAPEVPIKQWLANKPRAAAVVINVLHKPRKRDKVLVRTYSSGI